jgi:hypothetical protein
MRGTAARTRVRRVIMALRIYVGFVVSLPAARRPAPIDILYEPRIFVQNVDRKPP